MKMKNIHTLRKVFMVSAFALVLGSCKDDFTAPAPPSGSSLFTVASTNDNFNILTAVLNKTGQKAQLDNNNTGIITIFAPDDVAFTTYFKNTYPAAALVTEADVIGFVNGLTTTSTPPIATVNTLIIYHMISSKLTSALITGNQVFATLNGARLSISKGTTVTLNSNNATTGATVYAFDALASNGVIHTIDRVMNIVTNPIPANVLSTPFLGLTVSYATNPPTIGGGTTVGTANNYELMAVAIRKAGLAPTLVPNISPLPDFTIFSPSDAAWQTYLGVATEAAAQTAINALDPTALSNFLKYHIVSGRILTTDLTNGQPVNTLLDGNSFTIGISGSTVTLVDKNAASVDPKITGANNLTNSGIVHLIDAVLKAN